MTLIYLSKGKPIENIEMRGLRIAFEYIKIFLPFILALGQSMIIIYLANCYIIDR